MGVLCIVSMLCCWWLLLSVAGMVQVVCRRCGVSVCVMLECALCC